MTIIRLDLDALTARGALSTAEAERLAALALPERRGRLWINLLLVFGALAAAAGAIALVPDPTTGLVLALLSLGGGALLQARDGDGRWRVLCEALALIGALGLSGWIAWHFAERAGPVNDTWPALAIMAILAAGAVVFRSALLAALAVLAFGGAIGSGTAYWHASYFLFVREPALTIIAFTALAGALYAARERLGAAWGTVTSAAARTSVMVANFGFWIGSLWGDYPLEHWTAGEDWRAAEAWRAGALHIPDVAFTIGWALALLGLIARSRAGGFLSNLAIVFLAIHGYTQVFEVLGAQPWTLLLAGLSAVALAVAGARYLWRKDEAPAGG